MSLATLRATRRDVLQACVDYEEATDHNGADPLAAGARLRIMAKAYAKALRQHNKENGNDDDRTDQARSERPQAVADHLARDEG